MEDSFSMVGGGVRVQAVMQAMGSGGERQVKLCSLTSCCAARFLTGLRPVSVHSPGVGDPCFT